jgi:hypothetical protein
MQHRAPAPALLCLVVSWIGAARAAEDNDYLRYLPSDTKVVVTIHANALGEQEQKDALESMRRVFLTRLAPELPADEKLPISDVSRLVIAQPFVGTAAGVIVIRGKVDRALFEKQMRLAAKKSRKWLTVEKMGKPPVAVFRRQLDDAAWASLVPAVALVPVLARRAVIPLEVYIAALDDETIFLCLAGRLQMERTLRARPAKSEPRIADDLVRLLKKQDPKDLAAFVMLDNSLSPPLQLVAGEALRSTFDQFEHITGRVRAGKEVEISVTATGKSSEQGAELFKKAEQGLKLLREGLPAFIANKDMRAGLETLLKGVKITRKDHVVSAGAKLDLADARKLLPAVPPPEKKKKGR